MILRILQTALAVLLLSGSVAYADGGEKHKEGWLFPTIGSGRGHWEASVGLFLEKTI